MRQDGRCGSSIDDTVAKARGIFSMESYAPFFLRSAHRRFIDSDNRRLPSGVRRWRLFFFEAGVGRHF